MNASKRQEIFERLREAMPHPTTELEYTTPFELLIAVILSAQATDVSVNKATRKLYPVANTPEAIYALGVEGLMPYIQSIGLYRTKAKNVIETCRMLLEEHGGVVPRTREELQKLPGVGRKTANVVLNTAVGELTIAVDTHIFRVKRVPAEFLHDAHHWLILHGRYTCIARKPLCWNCIIADLCEYKPKTPLPVKGV
jgi:endonuclease-3